MEVKNEGPPLKCQRLTLTFGTYIKLYLVGPISTVLHTNVQGHRLFDSEEN